MRVSMDFLFGVAVGILFMCLVVSVLNLIYGML